MERSDLEHLLDTVSKAYPIVPKDYPVVAKLSEEELFAFSISHTAKHVAKALGKIAAEVEEADHGGAIDREKLRKATVSLLISTLKLADEQGMSGKELVEEVPKRL